MKTDAIVCSPPFADKEPFEDKTFVLYGKKLDENYTYSLNKNDKSQIANLKYLEGI